PADPAAPADPLDDPAAAPETMGDAAAPVAPADDMAADQGVVGTDWDTFEPVVTSEVSADELNGTTVYGSGDENIGSIGDIILSESGEVDALIIDFGGFLGIGTKPVAVGFDNLTFLRDGNGDLVLR